MQRRVKLAHVNRCGLVFCVSWLFVTVSHTHTQIQWWSRCVKPKMSCNDRFFFSHSFIYLFICSSFVWACPENQLCACCNVKEQFHSFKWHQKILFYVHSNFIPSASVSFGKLCILLKCVFVCSKVPHVSESHSVTGRVPKKQSSPEVGCLTNL